MSGQKEFFEACIACLDLPDSRECQDADVLQFLEALDYLPSGNSAAGNADDMPRANRRALLKLASRFQDTFSLPMPHAPGASFFGALVSPGAFGIAGHGTDATGAGGRGHTLGDAFESCAGEAAEYLSFLEWDDDRKIVSLGHGHGLDAQELAWAVAGIGLDGGYLAPDLDWVEAHSLCDKRPVLFPSELVLRKPVSRRLGARMAESNGAGAGATLEQAMWSGLMEVIERDAVAMWWFGGRPAKALGLDAERSESLLAFIETVRGGSDRPVWFLDLTTELRIPVAAALSADMDGQAVVAGFAADRDPDRASRRAFLELCQMERAQQFSLCKWRELGDQALKDMDTVWVERFLALSVENHPRLRMTEGSGEQVSGFPDATLSEIVAHLAASGFTPYAVDLTRPEIGIPVARIVVPGLQSAKPDWISKRLTDAADENSMDVAEIARHPCPI